MTSCTVFDDSRELANAAAEAIVTLAEQACRERGRFVCCLSGGQTPRLLYGLLASSQFAPRIDWARIHLTFGDERCVAPEDPASNYRMVHEALLQHVPIPRQHVYRMLAEQPPLAAAEAYETTLRNLLGVSANGTPLRPFDLVLLGLGGDGHTASLFPGSIDEPERWVSAREAQPLWRITLTPLALNAAQVAWFLVAGADKAQRVADVLEGPAQHERLPAQRIAPGGELRWWLDRAAAARLART